MAAPPHARRGEQNPLAVRVINTGALNSDPKIEPCRPAEMAEAHHMLDETHETLPHTPRQPVTRAVEWLLGIIAVVTSVAGAFLVLQQLHGIQYSGPIISALFTDLWPLPSLAFIAWVLLSCLGLWGIAQTGAHANPSVQGNALTGLAVGALLALALLSLFTIGALVLVAALALLVAACLAAIRTRHAIGRTLLATLIGAAAGFLLLILLIFGLHWAG